MRMAGGSDNLQPWLRATSISVSVLAIIAVALRILSRFEKKQKLWWDDWMIVWSLAWGLLSAGFVFWMLRCGIGLHANTVAVDDIVLMAKILLASEILYVFNLVWTKLSLLMMYYRIFRFPYFKRWAYIIGTFVVLWVICITFLFIFICVPVQKLWYPQLPGHCINQVGTWIANAISTILTDIAILLLPIPQIWKLRLQTSEKVVVTVAFGLGFFVIFASAFRFTVLFSYNPLDPTYTLARTVGWTAIEMSVGIVSACLPTMKPALRLFVRKLGIKGSIFDLFPSELSANRTNRTNQTDGSVALDTVNSTGKGYAQRGSQGAFYRLPDGTQVAVDAKLRPEHGYEYTVSSFPVVKVDRGSLSGDEVPLNNIHVKKDFSQETYLG